MENKQTAVEWLENTLLDLSHPKHRPLLYPLFEHAKAMERKQHGQTWDDAITAFKGRGLVESRAMCDFDEYWGKINIPISEGVDQPETYPEGRD